MGETVIYLIFAIFLILISGFFSGAESALFSLKRISSELISKNRFIKSLLDNPQKLLVTVFTGNDLANSTFSALITTTALMTFGREAEWIAAVMSMIVIVIIAEVLPRKIAFKNPETYSLVAGPPLYYFSKITYPFFLLTRLFSAMLPERLKRTSTKYRLSEKDLIALFKEGSSTGAIDEEERALLTQVLQLDRIRCSDIMTPRQKVEMVDWSLTREELEETLKNYRHSRIPVYRHRRDNIVGILYLKDLLLLPPGKDWHKIIKSPYFIPEVKTALSLLEQFRKKKMHIGIVVDEFGTYTGIITLSDVVKILFSEISGYMRKVVLRRKGRGFIVSGDTKIELLRLKGLNIPSGDYETISGFIMHTLGKFPKEGEFIEYEGWLIRVEKTDKKRVIKEVYLEKKK